MNERLSERLRQMKEEQSKSRVNNCREIVLAKKQVVEAAYKASGVRPRTARSRFYYNGDSASFTAGFSAGGRTSISSGAFASYLTNH
jgi:hypothetical protein